MLEDFVVQNHQLGVKYDCRTIRMKNKTLQAKYNSQQDHEAMLDLVIKARMEMVKSAVKKGTKRKREDKEKCKKDVRLQRRMECLLKNEDMQETMIADWQLR